MSSQTEVETRLHQASAKNDELLRLLSETDHAAAALSQQNRFIADLQSELKASDQRVKQLDVNRKKELKDHEKYRDSVMRRFAYKATGKREKFDAKAQKEETEYFAALQEEHRENEVNTNLKARLAEAQRAAQDLNELVKRHNFAQKELDNLYEGIFKGPTPGFPEEDEKERTADRAFHEYQNCRERAEAEQHAVRLLGEAQYRMRGSLQAVDEALHHSRVDMFGGGTFTDMMERNALHRAETEALGARMLVQQAQRFAPPGAIWELPAVNINHGNVMRDVFFDNIFTDMQFHDEIKKSRDNVERAARAVDQMARGTAERQMVLGQEMARKEKEFRDARVALQKARGDAFKRVTPAPAYEATSPAAAPAPAPAAGPAGGESSRTDEWWNKT